MKQTSKVHGPPMERKTAYLLWYTFLLLARSSKDPDIQAGLKFSKEFYRPWDVAEGQDMEEWWETHAHLFSEQRFVREMKPGARPSDPESLIVEIPLTKSTTALTKDVKKIIEKAAAKRTRGPFKSKKKPTARYSLSEGSEPKLSALVDILVVYQICLENEGLKGQKRLKAIHAAFAKNDDPELAKLPHALLYDPYDGDDKARALRNVNRFIKRAELVLFNVAHGTFPGEYGL